MSRRKMLHMLLLTAGLSLSCVGSLQANPTASYSMQIEQQLNDIFNDIRAFDLRSAGERTGLLTQTYPDFALGQLLHAELMSAAGLSTTLVGSDQPFSPQLLELLMEAQSRLLQSTLALDNTRLPDNLLQIGNDIDHIVTVDLEYSRLYLVKNNNSRPRIVAHHYAASGRGGYGKRFEGDLRTPTGVYRVMEFKPESVLPELYGAGALTLDYPNALDRHYNRTGSGIWLHGIPRNNLSRAPRSSEGCVVMPNDLFVDLQGSLNLDSTLVVLSGELGWQTRQELDQASERFIALFNDWRQAWIDNDLAELKNLHAQSLFQRASVGYFPEHAQQEEMKKLAQVATEDVTIIRYPVFPGSRTTTLKDQLGIESSRSNLASSSQIMMQFTLPDDSKTGTASQNPSTNLSSASSRMTLYWELNQDNQWRIVEFKRDPHLI